MFNEKSAVGRHDSEKMGLALSNCEPSCVHMTGEITDKIFVGGELVDTRRGRNLVVNQFLKLVMCLVKRQSGYSGITYWAVGSGASAWDFDMPTPDIDAVRLTNEIGRVAISPDEITFLTPDFEVSPTPTNIIQIRHLFGTADCNGVWREFGLFGGNATASPNSGLMVNKRHHAILTKTEEMTVERTMRFTLSLT